MDGSGATDECVCFRTAKSCGPDPPTLGSTPGSRARGDGGYQARYPGESTKELVKTIVQGMPDRSAYLWFLTRVLFSAHEAAGVQNARHSMRPLTGEGNDGASTRAQLRCEDVESCPIGCLSTE